MPYSLLRGAVTAQLVVAGLVGSTAVLIPSSVIAQGTILEEIVVTSQRREQSIQDVGIAITAFSAAQLDALGIEQSSDIANFTPGVHLSGASAGQNTQFTIRGVTQIDFADIVESPNAVYLDEGYLAIAQAQSFAVFDIDRVEILKGPQGTLFGRNATGGLVHYISRKPSLDEADGYLDVSVGAFDTDADAEQVTIEAAAGGPLSDTVAGRVAFRYNDRDGILNNLYPQSAPPAGAPGSVAPGAGAGADLGDDETVSGRASLLIQPNDNLSINLSANYSSSDLATGPYQSKSTIAVYDTNGELINVIDTPAGETRASIVQGTNLDQGGNFFDGTAPFPLTRPVPGGDFFGYIDPDGDGFNTSSDFAFDDHGNTDTWGLNGNVSFDLPNGVTFTSITDYKDYEKLLFIDVDGAAVNQLGNLAFVDANSFTQEFRLNGTTEKSRWVAGLFYLDVSTNAVNALKAPANSIIDVLTPGGSRLDIGVDSQLETQSYSVFGQFEYDITPTVAVTAGVRAIREEKDYEVAIGVAASPGNFSFSTNFFPGAFQLQDESSDTLWAGKLQLDWSAGDDTLIYAGINRGVKAGSFNAPLLGAFLGSGSNDAERAAALSYDEEILTSFEVGFKHGIGESSRLNGSVYYYDYQDYQAFRFVGVGGNVINADAENYGAELEFQTALGQGLEAIFSVSWLEATVEGIQLRANSPLPARDVSANYSPELQASAILSYSWEAFGGSMRLRGDVSYSDEFFYNLRNFDADKFDSYVLTNAGLSWVSNDGDWEFDFKIKNITDERAGLQGFDLATLCGCNEVSFRDPRFYGVSVRRNF